jgi:hypothetical protein
MHHYLVTHMIARYPESQDEWLDLWEEVLRNICGDSRWINSYYDPAEEKLYCLWEAESTESIRSCFTEEGHEIAPIEEIREVAYFDIESMSQELNAKE